MAEALLALLTQQRPNLQTRKGLIINSLQNDFVSSDGKLPVSIPPDYFEKLRKLVTEFREFGDVIWTRVEFEASRDVNSDDEGGDSVVIDTSRGTNYAVESEDDDDDERDSPVPPKRQRVSLEENDHITSDVEQYRFNDISSAEVDEELFLTQTATREPCCLPDSPGAEFAPQVENLIDPDKDLVFTSTHYSAFGSPSLLITLRSKLITDLFLCGGPTNLSVYATAMDAARYGLQTTLIDDCLVARSQERHELAIRRLCEALESEVSSSDEVIQFLRDPMSFDEERNVADGNKDADVDEYDDDDSEHKANGIMDEEDDGYDFEVDDDPDDDDPAFDASISRPALSQLYSHLRELRFTPPNGQNLVTMQLGSVRRSEPRESAPLMNGASSGSNIELDRYTVEPSLQPGHGNSEKRAESNPADGANCNRLASNESWAGTKNPVQEWLEPTRKATASSKHPGVNAIAALAPGLDQYTVKVMETDTFEELKARHSLNAQDTGTMNEHPLFGNGKEDESADSSILYDLLAPDLADTIFEKLNNEVTWQRMHHQSGEVPRLVCCQGSIGERGSTPIYRHPSDQTLPTEYWTPTVELVRKAAEEAIGHPLNHALIQLYRGGTDYISEHSDKTLDVVKGSYIVNCSFGAQRTMRLRSKRASHADLNAEPLARTIFRVPMPHNSMIKMSLATNAEYLHAINADKRPPCELSEAETAFNGHRVSITFRHIGTFLNKDSTKIWGQGATSKEEEFARPVVSADAAESERLVRAFGMENRTSFLQWDNIYGEGFDVLHLT